MAAGISSNSDSYSYEDLNCYFQKMHEVPREIDPIFYYAKHLIEQQPDLKKYHLLQKTLHQKVTEVGEQAPLADLAVRINNFIHDEITRSLAGCALSDPASVLQALREESDETLIIEIFSKIAADQPLLLRIVQEEKDEKILTLIALGCVNRRPEFLIEHIQAFKIHDQQALERLAREVAHQNVSVLCRNIQVFELANLDVRLELAKQVSYSSSLPKNIKNFNIPKEEDRFELALGCLERSFSEVIIEQLTEFEIRQPHLLFQLAKAAIQKYPEAAAAQIRLFGIQDQEELIALARESIIASQGASIQHLPLFNITDPMQKIALVELAAVLDGEWTARSIDTLGITDPDALFKIAKLCAHNTATTVAFLDQFKIPKGRGRLEIALICALKMPNIVIKFLGSLGIQEEQDRLELALVCVRGFPTDVVRNIQKFGLEEKSRLVVAHACIGHGFSKEIKRFNLKDLQQRIELARRCVQEEPNLVPLWIGEFEIGNDQLVLDFLKKCVSHNRFQLNQLVPVFSNCSDNQRVQLSETYFQKNPNGFIEKLSQLNIDSRLKLHFLKRHSTLPNATVPNISEIGIEDSVQRLELARSYLQVNPTELAEKIDFFNIRESSDRFELAERCFLENPASIPKYIDRFKLDENQRYLLALKCAQSPTSQFAKFVPLFDLPEPFEVALLSARHNAYETVIYLNNFKIDDPQKRLQVINVCIEMSPESAVKLINPEKIPSLENRIECARQLISSYPISLRFFKNFYIQDPAIKKELLDLYEAHHPDQFKIQCVYLIDPHIVPSEEERKRLAKIGSAFNPAGTIQNISNYVIEDHRFLIDLIKQIAMKELISEDDVNKIFLREWTKDEARRLYRMFKVKKMAPPLVDNEEERFGECCNLLMSSENLAYKISVIHQHYAEIHDFLSHFPELIEENKLPKVGEVLSFAQVKKIAMAYVGLKIMLGEKLFIPIIKERELESAIIKIVIEGNKSPSVLQIIQSHYPMIHDALSRYPSIIQQDQLPPAEASLSLAQMKKLSTVYLGLQLFPKEQLETQVIEKSELESLVIQEKLENLALFKDVLKKIISHRNPTQAFSYLGLLAYESSPEMIKGLKIGTQAALKPGSKEPYGKHLIPLLIPMLKLAKWAGQCHKPDLLIKLNEIFRESKIREHYFKAEAAGSDTMVQIWLKTIDLLDGVKELSTERKIQLLTQAAQPIKKLRDRLLLIQGVVCSECAHQLDRDFDSSIDDDLKGIIANGLLSDPYLNLSGVEDLMNKYMHTLATLRFPNGWKIYERGLQQTGEIAVQQAHQRFIVGVLNGTFRKERYQTTSSHIATIREKHEPIWQQWQQEESGRLIQLDGVQYRILNTDDWQDLLLSGTEVEGSCQRLDGYFQLNKGLQAYLLDGKIRMIAIKDPETNQIIARGLFRLLWDEKTQSPVLFLDQKYPGTLSKEMSDAINEYAIEEAKKLGCPLYSICPYQGSPLVDAQIVSKGSCAPYEYADSGARLTGQDTALFQNGAYGLRQVYSVWNGE